MKAEKNCNILIFKNILLKITILSLTPAHHQKGLVRKVASLDIFANSKILIVGSAFNLLQKKNWYHTDGSLEKEGMF